MNKIDTYMFNRVWFTTLVNTPCFQLSSMNDLREALQDEEERKIFQNTLKLNTQV